MAAGRKGRAGCRPSEFELLPTPLPMQPTTAKRRCAALHTEPLVDEFFTLLKSAETTAEPRTLPDFRPRAAAWKRQNTLPEPSEHPQTLSQLQFESPSLCRITRIHMHHYHFSRCPYNHGKLRPLETFLDVPTDFFIPPLKPRPKPELSPS